MDSQFSLSLELSELIPLVPLVKLASQAALKTVRSFSRTGSDLVTEHDLASIFGRTWIDERFASTFRTAMSSSANIYPITAALEVYLTVGPGPTVNHALQHKPFFSMLVQLSALLWSHNLLSLAKCILKVMAMQRNEADAPDVPDEVQMMGTLRCVREQTCGFLWGLEYQAVETILTGEIDVDIDLFRKQAINKTVFATLLEGLPMIQRSPEERLLMIDTNEGVSAIIIWAHKVLGLSIEVSYSNLQSGQTKSYVFGSDNPRIVLQMTSNPYATHCSAAVLNRTQDLIFRAAPALVGNMEPLWPSERHIVDGYGEAFWRFHSNHLSLRRPPLEVFAEDVCTHAIKLVEHARKERIGVPVPHDIYFPPLYKVISVCKLLFPNSVATETLEECAESCTKMPFEPGDPLRQFSALRQALLDMLLAFCYLHEPKAAALAPLKIPYSRIDMGEIRTWSYRSAFKLLHFALNGDLDRAQEGLESAVSSCGWTLVMGVVHAPLPAKSTASIALVPGVPTRNGVQRRLIRDIISGDRSTWGSSDVRVIGVDNQRYMIIAGPGQEAILDARSFDRVEVDYFVSNGLDAFIVYREMRFRPAEEWGSYLTIRVGLVQMQRALWSAYPIDIQEDCGCPKSSSPETIVVPPRTWIYTGLISGSSREPRVYNRGDKIHKPWNKDEEVETHSNDDIVQGTREKIVNDAHQMEDAGHQSRECRLQISQTAGNDNLRWLQLLDWTRSHSDRPIHLQFLRPDYTCLDCAVKYIKTKIVGTVDDAPYQVCLIA